MMINKYLKISLYQLVFQALKAWYIFPVKRNRILFESFDGNQTTCNPFYLYKAIKEKYPQGDFIWCYNKNDLSNIKYAKKHSLKYIYYLITSKVYICNSGIPIYIPFRKQQIVINTWHGGGCYKNTGFMTDITWLEKYILKKASQRTTFFISSSKIFSDVINKSFRISLDKFLPFGMPRNDIFFSQSEKDKANSTIRQYYKIHPDTFIVLYAPTYRGKAQEAQFNNNINIEILIKAIQTKFQAPKVCVMFRSHYFINSLLTTQEKMQILNVSDYKYMQELLCAADMLISDYSSCIWDYSFTYRPCILFTPDLQDYKSERDFYHPIETWGFPIAQTNEELQRIIQTFDINQFAKTIKHHHDELKSYEQGKAITQTILFIENLIK